jgi:hypothetical protein
VRTRLFIGLVYRYSIEEVTFEAIFAGSARTARKRMRTNHMLHGRPHRIVQFAEVNPNQSADGAEFEVLSAICGISGKFSSELHSILSSAFDFGRRHERKIRKEKDKK